MQKITKIEKIIIAANEYITKSHSIARVGIDGDNADLKSVKKFIESIRGLLQIKPIQMQRASI